MYETANVALLKKFYNKAQQVEMMDGQGIPYYTRAVTLDAIEDVVSSTTLCEIPCKLGDFVWAIRCYHGVPHAQQGKVTEMLFTKDMKLQIVVSHISRGQWMEKVFPTRELAEQKIEEMKTEVRTWWK